MEFDPMLQMYVILSVSQNPGLVANVPVVVTNCLQVKNVPTKLCDSLLLQVQLQFIQKDGFP